MDAFVVKTRDPKANDKSKCSTKTTVMERHAQFPKETHVAGQKLFCTSCNLVLDHTRKSSVSSHLGSGKHKQKRDLTEKSNQPAKKQRVLTESSSSVPSTIASQERNELCMEWVAMLAAANIPLSKTDQPAVRDFLHKRVVNGGAIPHRKQLQECYLEREYSKRKEEVKLLLKGKAVSIMTDEMSDDNGRACKKDLAERTPVPSAPSNFRQTTRAESKKMQEKQERNRGKTLLLFFMFCYSYKEWLESL